MTTFTQRPQRANAGKTSKYSDYSVVSFPQLKKHSIIKSSLINIDPLSPIGAQSGSIKAFGDRKKLMIIKTGMFKFFFNAESKEYGNLSYRYPSRNARDFESIF
jgi:hypothetical protein